MGLIEINEIIEMLKGSVRGEDLMDVLLGGWTLGPWVHLRNRQSPGRAGKGILRFRGENAEKLKEPGREVTEKGRFEAC